LARWMVCTMILQGTGTGAGFLDDMLRSCNYTLKVLSSVTRQHLPYSSHYMGVGCDQQWRCSYNQSQISKVRPPRSCSESGWSCLLPPFCIKTVATLGAKARRRMAAALVALNVLKLRRIDQSAHCMNWLVFMRPGGPSLNCVCVTNKLDLVTSRAPFSRNYGCPVTLVAPCNPSVQIRITLHGLQPICTFIIVPFCEMSRKLPANKKAPDCSDAFLVELPDTASGSIGLRS